MPRAFLTGLHPEGKVKEKSKVSGSGLASLFWSVVGKWKLEGKKMNKYFMVIFGFVCFLLLSGCAGTIPTDSYSPQNYVRYDHHNKADMGAFTYAPLANASLKMKPNQIQNTALGSIYISTNVADMVKRATALELEKTGIVLTDQSSIAIGGDVLEFKADDLGYSVHWTYAIRYKIIDKNTRQNLYVREYRPEMKKTGKFGLPSDLAPIVHEIVLNGYDLFIRDPEVRKILDSSLP